MEQNTEHGILSTHCGKLPAIVCNNFRVHAEYKKKNLYTSNQIKDELRLQNNFALTHFPATFKLHFLQGEARE